GEERPGVGHGRTAKLALDDRAARLYPKADHVTTRRARLRPVIPGSRRPQPRAARFVVNHGLGDDLGCRRLPAVSRALVWRAAAGGFNETFETASRARPHYQAVLSILRAFPSPEIERRERLQQLSLLNQGITFTVYGQKEGIERIFPFDFVPRIITATEWRHLEAGLVQRVTALNLFLLDIYGE